MIQEQNNWLQTPAAPQLAQQRAAPPPHTLVMATPLPLVLVAPPPVAVAAATVVALPIASQPTQV